MLDYSEILQLSVRVQCIDNEVVAAAASAVVGSTLLTISIQAIAQI